MFINDLIYPPMVIIHDTSKVWAEYSLTDLAQDSPPKPEVHQAYLLTGSKGQHRAGDDIQGLV